MHRHVLYMSIGAALGAVIGGHNARTAGIIGGLIGGFVIAGNNHYGIAFLNIVFRFESRLHFDSVYLFLSTGPKGGAKVRL